MFKTFHITPSFRAIRPLRLFPAFFNNCHILYYFEGGSLPAVWKLSVQPVTLIILTCSARSILFILCSVFMSLGLAGNLLIYLRIFAIMNKPDLYAQKSRPG